MSSSRPRAPASGAPGAGPDAAGPDPALLDKVRALLAKAESTTFPEEADALTAKAQELMARHAIEAAMLADGVSFGVDGVERRDVAVVAPYARAKVQLLSEVARANRCRVIWTKSTSTATVFGHPDDVAAAELLFTSLLVQATGAMLRHGTRSDGRTRAFRHAFLVAFAARIGVRLVDAQTAVVDEHERGDDGHEGDRHGSLVPVLAGREAAVEQATAEAFPNVRSSRVSISSRAGVGAGTDAAERAALGLHDQVGPRPRGALRRARRR